MTTIERTDLARDALYNKVNVMVGERADRSFSNLDSTGQMIIYSQNGTISNCILDIPQNLKLELSNGILTVKQGSVLVMSGSSTYTTITVNGDKTKDFSSYQDGKIGVFANNIGVLGQDGLLSRIGSGNSLPADNTTYSWFYLTTDYSIYHYEGSGWVKKVASYPLCILEKDSSGVRFAKDSNGNDMIFNGAGFIGHHAFVYPGVKFLRPNGFNTQGKLKSDELTLNSLLIYEMKSNVNSIILNGTSSGSTRQYYEVDNLDTNLQGFQYVKSENIDYFWNGIEYVKRYETKVVDFTIAGTTVTDFAIRQPVRTATVEMLDKVQDQVDTNTTAISGKQDTLVSGTNIKTINSTTVLGNGNFALANQSLSNLDSTGQMIVDSQNGTISNCILDIPHTFTIEQSGNTFTLKSGSTVALVNRNTYTTTTITHDFSTTVSYDGLYFLVYSGWSLVSWMTPASLGSGTSLPADNSQYQQFFLIDGASGKYYLWNSDWTAWGNNSSYPLALVKVENGTASFAKDSNGNDMIFNGAGFIGHHAFVYPNVKSLMPNGFNDDGSLKSVSATTNSLQIIELTSAKAIFIKNNLSLSNDMGYYEVESYEDIGTVWSAIYYVRKENAMYLHQSSNIGGYVRSFLIGYTYNGTTVTDFAIRQPVRTATVEMLQDKQDKLTFDNTPTQNSINPVTSGGIYAALSEKSDNSSVVHLSGDESIPGNKTFSGTLSVTTQPTSNSSTAPATTAFVKSLFVEGEPPVNADPNVFYYTLEE